MSRNKGTFNFAANFEVLAQAPLDARMLVGSYTDLVLPATWEDSDNLVWLFNGAIVVVANDPYAGIYWCKDAANYTNYDSWEQAGKIAPYDPSALYAYIDASLVARDASINNLYLYTDASLLARDASINNLYSRINVIDSSISYLINWNTSLDASIQRIDASISELYTRDVSIGVINIGDGSANIFAGYDSSNNIQLRTLVGLGAALVSQIGNTIIIGLDASFAGEVNYGVNVGSGDASIYYQKLGDALQFRELLAGPNISLDVSDNLIIISSSGSVGGINGGVWITDINPTGSGNVGDKVTSSDGVVLDSCLTDTSILTVSILALPGHTNYKPNITINSNPVNLTASLDKPVFTGSYNINYNFSDASITVHHEDGARWSTVVDADTPAVILSADFINGYPGAQTQLKAGDTFNVRVQTDVSISSVIVDDYGASSGGTYAVSGNNVTFTVTIANRGTSTQALGLRIRVVKPTGSTSANYLTASQGSVNGKDLVNLNNTYPTATWGLITYPGAQGAIKLGETASVVNTLANYDTVLYSSPNGELGIPSPSVPLSPLVVSYSSGTYNISNNNLRMIAIRNANNAITTSNTVVWIANTPVTLSVTNPASRLRSGGNDGTSAQNHTITINASQRLLNAPTLTKDIGGTWLGGGFTWSSSATSFTRSLQVHDNDTKATYNWGSILATNLAGIQTMVNSGSTTYTLGGFVIRTISVAAFGWQSNINVAVSDYSKLSSSGSGQTLSWTVKDLTIKSTIGNITRPQANTWSALSTFNNPTTINILDKSATDSASQASTFTIQEGI